MNVCICHCAVQQLLSPLSLPTWDNADPCGLEQAEGVEHVRALAPVLVQTRQYKHGHVQWRIQGAMPPPPEALREGPIFSYIIAKIQSKNTFKIQKKISLNYVCFLIIGPGTLSVFFRCGEARKFIETRILFIKCRILPPAPEKTAPSHELYNSRIFVFLVRGFPMNTFHQFFGFLSKKY